MLGAEGKKVVALTSTAGINDDEEIREKGVVDSLNNGIGFLQCDGRSSPVIFNLNEVVDKNCEIALNDEVEFTPKIGPGLSYRRSILQATRIKLLQPYTAKFMTFVAGNIEGVITRETEKNPVKLQDFVEGGMVAFNYGHERKTVKFLIKGCMKPKFGDNVLFDLYMVKSTKELIAIKKLDPPCRKQETDSNIALTSEWNTLQSDNSLQMYNNLHLKETAQTFPVKDDKEESPKIPGETREYGIVTSFKKTYGYLRCVERLFPLYFHFSEILDANHRVAINDEFEFTVVPGLPYNFSHLRAVRLKHLPSNTVQFEVSIRKNVEGTVVRVTLKLPANPKDRVEGGEISYDQGEKKITFFLKLNEKKPSVGDSVQFDIHMVKRDKNLIAVNVRKMGHRRELELEQQQLPQLMLTNKMNQLGDKNFNGDSSILAQNGFLPMDRKDNENHAKISNSVSGKPCKVSGEKREQGNFSLVEEGYDPKNDNSRQSAVPNTVKFDMILARHVEGFVMPESQHTRRKYLDDGGVGSISYSHDNVKKNIIFYVKDCEKWVRNGDRVQFDILVKQNKELIAVKVKPIMPQKQEQSLHMLANTAISQEPDHMHKKSCDKLMSKGVCSTPKLEDVTQVTNNNNQVFGVEREQGIVASLRDTFGFLTSVKRAFPVLFHYTEVVDKSRNISLNDEVEFTVVQDPCDLYKSSRLQATCVQHLPPNTVHFEILVSEKIKGFVSLKSHTNLLKLHDRLEDGLITFIEGHAQRTVIYCLKEWEKRPSVGDLVIFDLCMIKRNKDLVAINVQQIEDKQQQPQHLLTDTTNQQAKTLKLDGVDGSTGTDGDAYSALMLEQTSFSPMNNTQLPSGPKIKNFNVHNNSMFQEEDSKTYFGFIVVLKKDYGFIETMSHDDDVFFHFSNCAGNINMLHLGQEVEYTFSSPSDNCRRATVCVRMLPRGTITQPAILEDVFNGVVSRPLRRVNPDRQVEYAGIIKMLDDAKQGALFQYEFGATSLVNKRHLLRKGDLVTFQIDEMGRAAEVIAVRKQKYPNIDVENEKKLNMSEVQAGDTVDFPVVTNQRNGKSSACNVVKINDRPDRLISRLKLNGDDTIPRLKVIRAPRGPKGKAFLSQARQPRIPGALLE